MTKRKKKTAAQIKQEELEKKLSGAIQMLPTVEQGIPVPPADDMQLAESRKDLERRFIEESRLTKAEKEYLTTAFEEEATELGKRMKTSASATTTTTTTTSSPSTIAHSPSTDDEDEQVKEQLRKDHLFALELAKEEAKRPRRSTERLTIQNFSPKKSYEKHPEADSAKNSVLCQPGDIVEIFWNGEKTWFTGIVLSKDEKKSEMLVCYEDGDWCMELTNNNCKHYTGAVPVNLQKDKFVDPVTGNQYLILNEHGIKKVTCIPPDTPSNHKNIHI